MPEGRVQLVTHHTPEHLWQARYLGHPNGALALEEVYVVVADLEEATSRYRAYLDLEPGPWTGAPLAEARRIATAAGSLTLLTPAGFERLAPGTPVPALPYVAGYRLRVADLEATARVLGAGGLAPRVLPGGALALAPDSTCGASVLFSR
jgi:hypothetical protein